MISGALRSFRAELFRLRRSRHTLVALILLFAASFLRTGAVQLAARSQHAGRVQRAVLEGRTVPEAPLPENAYGPWLDGWAAGAALGTLLLLVVAARSLAGDAESGLSRQAFVRGTSRAAQVLGRILIGLILVPGTILITGLGSLAGALAFFRFGDLVIDGALVLSEPEMREAIPPAALALLPPLFAAWCFGLLISSLCRGSVLALVTTLLPFLAFDLFKEALGDARQFVFASFAPTLVDQSCMKETAGVVRGFFDMGYTADRLSANFSMPLPQALLFAALALLFFHRRAL